MDRVANAEFKIGQQFAPVSIEHNVLTRAEKCDRGREVSNCPDRKRGLNIAEKGDTEQQTNLCDQHPATSPTKKRQRVAVHDRRPEELPRVGKSDQRKKTDFRETNTLNPQPRRHQLDQDVERQARGKARKRTDQYAPVKQGLPERRFLRFSHWSPGRSVTRRPIVVHDQGRVVGKTLRLINFCSKYLVLQSL